MKKLVALLMALLMAIQGVAFVYAEDVYEAEPEVVLDAEVEASATVEAQPVEPQVEETDIATDDIVVVEEEGVQLEEDVLDPSDNLTEKALYGAHPLPVDGKDVTGKVTAQAPNQAYVATLPATGILTLVVNVPDAMRISILNEAMTVHYEDMTALPAGTKTFNKHLNAGVYTVIMFRDNLAVETPFTLNASFQSVGATISGTSILNPYQLTFGADYASGAITESERENWILLRTAAVGKVTIETKTYSNNFVAELSLTKSPFDVLTPRLLNSGTPNAPGSTLFSFYLEPGAYFMRITKGPGTGAYDIRASFTGVNANDTEPNDGIGIAQAITIGKTIRGVLTESDDVDTYSVMVDKPMDVIFQVSDYTQGLWVSMNSWLNTVNMAAELSKDNSPGTETKPDVRQKRVRLEPGVMYYIQISKVKLLGPPLEAKPGYYDLRLINVMTVESVTSSPMAGPTGVTLTLTAKTSQPGTMYAFEPLLWDEVTSDWVNAESPNYKIFSSTPTAQYRPTKKGVYVIRCWVYDGYQWAIGQTQEGIVISDHTVVTAVGFPTNSVPRGQPMTVTIATTNAPPLLYGLRMIDKSTMQFVGDIMYSNTNQFTVTPQQAGNFIFYGMAFDGFQWSAGYSFDLNVYSALKLVSLTADRTTATTADQITYKLTTNGEPMNMVAYIYSIGSVEIHRNMKTGPSMYSDTYKSPYVGELNVKVHAFDGDKWFEIVGPKVNISSNVPTVSGLKREFEIGYVGQPLTFTINGSGTPDVTIYTIFDSSFKAVASSSKRSNTFSAVLNKAGAYLCRLVYTINGVTQTVETSWFYVDDGTNVYSILASPNPVKVNTPIGYNMLFTGTAPTRMEVYTYRKNGPNYDLVGSQVLNGTTTTTFVPTQPGEYSVIVFVNKGAVMDHSKPFSFWALFNAIP